MAGICTNSVRDSGGSCEHLTLTVDLDGSPLTIKTGHNDPRWLDALTDEEKDTLLRLLARWWKGKGADLAAFIGRVLAGEEATNVEQYLLLSKDVTKTNIGTAYVNVPPGANGERSLVEFTGCTELRLVLNMNAVGTGPWQVRVVRDGDSAVLYESPNITGAGEKELDTGWLPMPAQASGLELVRFQAKSSVGADDPVFRRLVMLVR
jgi:hypothetical protein